MSSGEIDQISVGVISNGRNLFARRVGRLSPAKIERINSEHLVRESNTLLGSDRDVTGRVRRVIEAASQRQRTLNALELAEGISNKLLDARINELVGVLMNRQATKFPDRYVAAVDWIQGASETISEVALAYQTVRSGADKPIADALGSLVDLPFPVPNVGEQAQAYVDLTQRAEGAGRLLMHDPTGKAVVRGYRDHIMKQPVNIDATKGPITRFYLTGVDLGIRLYETYYNKSIEVLGKK